MKIVAFLQNPWFRPGTNPLLIKKYRTDQEFHRRVLFMSATGRALHAAFSQELYGKIMWENANPAHGDERRSKLPADIGHMATVLVAEKPDLIICFGREARKGMNKLMSEHWPNVLFAPHPMAHGSAAEHLREVVDEVRKLCKQST